MPNVNNAGTTVYLCWLMNQARVDAEGPDGYEALCRILSVTPFHCCMEMDENRAAEGLELRTEWARNETPDAYDQDLLLDEVSEDLGEGECTMMELLVALSRKMQYEMLESQFEAGTGKWFMELLDNCGLDIFTNQVFGTSTDAEESVREIVMRIIFRKYEWTGNGGLFPLQYPGHDIREDELIIQMNNYIAENYDIL